MSKLSERFRTSLTLEGAFTRVGPQMNFKVGQLAEYFVTGVTPVLQFVVLLTQGIGKSLVASVVQKA